MKAAIALGDLSENSEYDDAKNEQAFIEGEILTLESQIRNSEIIKADDSNKDVVHLGNTVVIKDMEYDEDETYTIVGSTEADTTEGKISNESPVGMAILGKTVGTVVQVKVPAGTLEYKIVEIKKLRRGGLSLAKQHIEEKQQDINELMQVRRDKMQAFIDKGIEPFGRSYDVTHHAQELLDQFETLGEETVVRVAGRLMAVRGHGKASFTVVSDLSGKIQAYFRLDNLGEEKYGEFKLLDIGDIIGVEGTLFKTHRGEITIKVSDFSILAKSLRPLPEKFHGLKDVETRYRQRYLDLIVNPDVRQTFITRTKIIKSIRNYLDSRNFLEVETPVLSPIAGGANARPFITHHNALDIDMYLRIATELYLKRLVVGGFERVYEIGRIFRNEGIDVRHNPEFTSIEVYQAYADFNELMDLAEGIIKQAAMDACGTTKITYEGTEIDLSNFRRVTMNDIVLETTGKDFSKVQTLEEAQAIAQELAVPCEGKHSIGEILYEVFDEKVESTLIQPTIVTQYPTEVSPLSKRNKENPAFTDRFEMFIYGRELANAFSELNDPIDQEQRFIDQQKAREGGDDEAHMMDHDYITALEYGLPPTCGLGIGIDRLVMFLTDSSSIRDVLLFPTMKPIEN